MPVQKFKRFEDAERALWNFKPDAQYYRKISEWFTFASKLRPPGHPRGVFKFRTPEEANRFKMKWIIENAKESRW